MKNQDQWQPSKYVMRGGRLRASRDPNALSPSSRLVVDLVAECYQRYLPAHAAGRLIDLGCGQVPLFAAYRGYVTDNICVDWAETIHPSDHRDLICDLSRPLPFNDGEFNTIILSDVLEHVPTPELLFREMARILAPAGKLIMNSPFLYWVHEGPHDYYRFTEFALKRLAEMAGLEPIVLTPLGGGPEVLTDLLAKNLQRLPLLGGPLAVLLQELALWFYRTRQRLSPGGGRSFPLQYFLIAQKPGPEKAGSLL